MTQAEAPFNIGAGPRERDLLNILIASENSRGHMSGVRTSVEQAARYALEQNHDVLIVAPGGGDHTPNDIPSIQTPYRIINKFPTAVGMFPTVIEHTIFNRKKFDIVHGASPMNAPGGGLFLVGNTLKASQKRNLASVAIYQTDPVQYLDHIAVKTFEKVRRVPGLHRAEHPTRNWLRSNIIPRVRDIHNRANVNLAPSDSAIADLRRWGVKEEGLHIWKRGVDIDTYHPRRKELDEVKQQKLEWAPSGETIVGVVTRIDPVKSLEDLAALKDIPNIKIIIIGKGDEAYVQKLKALLGDKVIFAGEMRDEQLANGFAAIDVFVSPSTSETFGQANQEAKAAGLPIVAAAAGGTLDIIKDQETGYLYEPGDFVRFRELVEYFVSNPQARAEIGKNARQSVEHLSWSVFGSQLIEFYRLAIEMEQRKAAFR